MKRGREMNSLGYLVGMNMFGRTTGAAPWARSEASYGRRDCRTTADLMNPTNALGLLMLV